MLNKSAKLSSFLAIPLVVLAVILSGCDLEMGTTARTLPATSTTTTEATATNQAISTWTPTLTTVPTGTPTLAVSPTETVTPELPTATDTETATPGYTPQPTRTKTAPRPTRTPSPKPPSPTQGVTLLSPSPEASATPEGVPTAATGNGRMVNGKWYDAYVDASTKKKQYYHYTCEFDAAWVVLKSNGIDTTLEDQVAIVGLDTSIEPYYKETADGIFIYGGDILHSYSGDYTKNFLARSTGVSMRRVFEHYGLSVTAVHTREDLEAQLGQGKLVWIKTTADFKPGRPATWVMPDGSTYATVLGNDHAAAVMGYSERGALIRL